MDCKVQRATSYRKVTIQDDAKSKGGRKSADIPSKGKEKGKGKRMEEGYKLDKNDYPMLPSNGKGKGSRDQEPRGDGGPRPQPKGNGKGKGMKTMSLNAWRPRPQDWGSGTTLGGASLTSLKMCSGSASHVPHPLRTWSGYVQSSRARMSTSPS